MSQLPTYELKLQESRQDEDAASLALIHNLNIKEIEEYVNAIKNYVSTNTSEVNGSTSMTQDTFNEMLQNAKSSVTLLAGMTDGQTIEFNGYELKRLGYTEGPTDSVTFEITDLDEDRNTDFRKVHVFVKDYSGNNVYPPIKTTLTNIKIYFELKSSVESTQADNSTDPNNKTIILL